jgi:NitT/TauT family transport system substrate-binding protein
LGVPGEFSTHRVLLHLLGARRPELASLPTQVVNPSFVLTQLRQNGIGGFFCAEPWSAKCASEGLGQRLLRSREILPDHLCCILAVRREFAESRSEVVTGYLRLLQAARDRVRRDFAYAAKVQAACTGIEPAIARQVLEDRAVTFDDLTPDAARMASFLHLAQESGVLAGPCSLAGFACPDLLPASA